MDNDNGSGDRPRGRGRGARGITRRPASPTTGQRSASPGKPEVKPEVKLVSAMEQLSTMAQGPGRDRSPSPVPEMGFRGTSRGIKLDTPSRFLPICTKPEGMGTKHGTSGRQFEILCNFFALKKVAAWVLHQYQVEIQPQVDVTKIRRAILYAQSPTLGQYMFHGEFSLFSCTRYDSPLVLTAPDKIDPTKIYTITLTHVREVQPGDQQFIHFYDIILKKIMHGLELTEQNGVHFDTANACEITKHKLTLYPGYKATMRSYEKNVLLNIDLKTKVIRTDSALAYIKELLEKTRNSREKTDELFAGSIVMTTYNKKTHKISRIAWELNPSSTFPTKDGPVSYEQYYKTRYNIAIKDKKQPLLLAAPDKRAFHRLQANQAPQDTYLVPELCNPTGLTDDQRANFTLMKDLAQYLHAGPDEKVNQLNGFMKRIRNNVILKEFLASWSISFEESVHRCYARELSADKLIFANKVEYTPEKPGDWGNAFRGANKMITSKDLKHWVLIVTERDSANVESLISSMQKVAKPLGMNINKPEIRKSSGNRANEYKDVINKTMKEGSWDLVMVILFNNNADTYGQVKSLLSVEQGQPSQCFLARNMGAKGLMSIATKVVIQINAKLGGEPWGVKIPLKGLMIAGYDTYRGGKHTFGKAVGAMVSTTKGDTFSTYFSSLNLHSSPDEMARNVCSGLTKAISAYKTTNGSLPDVIFFYRDGVGDGSLQYVIEIELAQVKVCLKEAYGEEGLPLPKFAFIVVIKGTSTKLFKPQGGKNVNPPPGTVCDDTVTLPERYDFYLIPQTVRQGTVSPTSFNVICDTTNLDPDKMQRLTYKLCHLYYNYTGTVAVPAPCQYAHKLALQTGTATGKAAAEKLAYKLHFL